MADFEVKKTIQQYESWIGVPATDVLLYDTEKIISKLFAIFPKLKKKAEKKRQYQE